MKKLLFLVLLCAITTSLRAQVNSIGFQNTSSCDVWIVLYGSTGACATTHSSNPIQVPAGATFGYSDPTAVPGGMNGGGTTLGATDVFTRVQVLEGNPAYAGIVACLTPGGPSITGSGCLGPTSTSLLVYDVIPFTCNLCGNVTVQWTAASPTAAVIEIF
ncbi:MAG: hypothetical protein R2800_08270 [Flavipsychrobacter sp.]